MQHKRYTIALRAGCEIARRAAAIACGSSDPRAHRHGLRRAGPAGNGVAPKVCARDHLTAERQRRWRAGGRGT